MSHSVSSALKSNLVALLRPYTTELVDKLRLSGYAEIEGQTGGVKFKAKFNDLEYCYRVRFILITYIAGNSKILELQGDINFRKDKETGKTVLIPPSNFNSIIDVSNAST
ncbi:MAG: hypothetical protein MI892_24540, partial [Desulfobacterales bacterium]|nr:hypothetical protein [Desulfobacterales bacterium]